MADNIDYRDYFSLTSVDALIDHARRSHETIWPALEKIIRTHSIWGDPLVVEGYALWPEWVMTADFTATRALWLTCNNQLFESRIRSQKDFYQGASDEEMLIENILRRSSRYNELMIESALEYFATVISIGADHSVDDVADLCVSALAED